MLSQTDRGLSAILCRDVAYYLLNVPSFDCDLSPKKVASKKLRYGKYRHFALRCVDAFILYDKLYYDYTVPNPLDLKEQPYSGPLGDSLRTINQHFDEKAQEFYEALHKSGCLSRVKIEPIRFQQILSEVQQYFLDNKAMTKEIYQEMLKNTPDFYKRFYTDSVAGLLEEESIFYRQTLDLILASQLKQPLNMDEFFSYELKRNQLQNEMDFYEPWVFSAMLCARIQAELSIPGVYSTFSYPYCAYNSSLTNIRLMDIAYRKALKGSIEYYKSISPAKVCLKVPSFSYWCQGTGQSSETFSNMEIMERALELRKNRHITAFRSRLKLTMEKLLGEMSENSRNEEEIIHLVANDLSSYVQNLLSNLEPSFKSQVRESLINVLVGFPLSAFGPFEKLADFSLDISRQILDGRRKERNLGWLFFLQNEISGYPLEKGRSRITTSPDRPKDLNRSFE